MKNASRCKLIHIALLACLLLAGAVAPQRHTVVAQTTPNEARVVVKIIAEHPGDCPARNLRMYTFVYIEGAGVPDANGYVIAKARATTDITILDGRVLSVTPSHHEWEWDVPIRLEQFPPTPVDGITTTHSLDVIFSALPPTVVPDVSCMYIDFDGEVKETLGKVEVAPRSFIAMLKGALFGLGGMQRNTEGVYGVEGEYRGPNNSTFKYTAEWFAGPVTPDFDVIPDVKGLFIGGVPIDVFYDYTSRWEDDGALNGVTSVKHGGSVWQKTEHPAPKTERKVANPGTAIDVTTQMEGQVVLNNGRGSTVATRPFDTTRKPRTFKTEEIKPAKVGEAVAYKIERLMPEPAWSAKYTFPQSFPAPLKGKEWKAKAQMKVLFETNSLAAPATIKAGIGGEAEAAAGVVAGKLKVEGHGNFQYDKAGLEFLKGSGKADFQIGYKDKYGPFDLVPQLRPMGELTGVSAWLEEYMRVEVGLYAIAVGNVDLYQSNGLAWKAKIQPGLRVSAKAIAGKDDSKVRAEVEAVGEGRLNLYLNDPANPFFGGADGEVKFTASLIAFAYKASFERKMTFNIGSASVMQAGATLATPPQISFVSDGYTGGETFVEGRMTANSADADTVTTLVGNASPLAEPHMDANGRATCWVSQRNDVPASRNSEIVCATGNTPSFLSPKSVTNDALADAGPDVAQAGASAPIVTWWRHTDPALGDSAELNAAFMQQTDVMVSAYDAGAGTWSAPQSVGAAGVLDYAPQAAGNGAGRGLVVWRANAAGQLAGFGSTPDTVKAVMYDATAKTWSAPQNLHSAAGLLDVRAAYGSNEAAVVYSIDADGVATTTHDVEIWAQRHVSGTWQAPVRLTNNAENDGSPRIAYDTSGQPVIVWLRSSVAGETSVMLLRGWAGTPEAASFNGASAPTTLNDIAVNAAGDIALLWSAAYEGYDLQHDLAYAVFSAAGNSWSAPMRLTNDAAHNDDASLAWRNTTEFNVVYDRASRMTLTDTVSIDGAAKPYTYTVANPNDHDVVVLRHALLPAQPAVPQDGLVISPANAAPGQPATVTATVRNLGDLPAGNVEVVLGLSDARLPVASAPVTTIATTTLQSLRGGESTAAAFTVNLPARPNRLVAQVRCATGCAAAPKPDATLVTTLPDLEIASAYVDRDTLGGVSMVRAEIVNTGVVSATRARMTVFDDNGTLGTSEVYITPTTGLQPGARVTGFYRLDSEPQFTGAKALTVTVTLLDAGGEASEANNTMGLDWIRQPDWSLGSRSAVLGAPGAAGTPITITAYNVSDVDAPAVAVQVYSAHPDEGGTLLWQGALPAAEAWKYAQVSTVLPGSVPRAFVRVNMPETVSELSAANNTARAGRGFTGGLAGPFRLWLPVAGKR